MNKYILKTVLIILPFFFGMCNAFDNKTTFIRPYYIFNKLTHNKYIYLKIWNITPFFDI